MIFQTVSTFEVIAEQYLPDVFNSKSFTELGFSLRPENNDSCKSDRQCLFFGGQFLPGVGSSLQNMILLQDTRCR